MRMSELRVWGHGDGIFPERPLPVQLLYGDSPTLRDTQLVALTRANNGITGTIGKLQVATLIPRVFYRYFSYKTHSVERYTGFTGISAIAARTSRIRGGNELDEFCLFYLWPTKRS